MAARKPGGNECENPLRAARAHDCIVKVARTIADLDGGETSSRGTWSEAIQYRP